MIPAHLPRTPNEFLSSVPRAVVHLRAQLQRKRLGLVFGAGVSKDLDFPDWDTLIRKIAHHKHVKGESLLRKFLSGPKGHPKSPAEKRSLASITQMLFGTYRANVLARRKLTEPLTFLDEQQIRTDWMKIIHGALYEKVSTLSREARIRSHKYILAFLALIKQSPMTVNYNFDDTLEKLLMFSRDEQEKVTTRGYESMYKPNLQFKNDHGVIYHPNGYLPSVFEDGASPELIFSDESFHDQLISTASGQHIQLSNFIFRNTCLLVGISLEDTTLQHLLRQSAINNPGHVHYVIHYVKSDDQYDYDACKAIFDANFSCYNLYTLFLNSDGIKTLADLVSLPEGAFEVKYAGQRRKFVYYIIGAVGVGNRPQFLISAICTLTTNGLMNEERTWQYRRSASAKREKSRRFPILINGPRSSFERKICHWQNAPAAFIYVTDAHSIRSRLASTANVRTKRRTF
jgi:hypothetical protein